MRAINEIRLDHYLMKPWHPPEERLYPVLDDLLEDWRAAVETVAAGTETDGDAVSVIGHHFSTESQRVRDLLANNQIAYRWLEVDEEPARRLLAEAVAWHRPAARRARCRTPSRSSARDPAEVAARVGLQTEEELALYDLVVVGAGPAGLAAAVYGASEGLRTVVVERLTFGGQAGASSRIENYLGFPVRAVRCGPRASGDHTGAPFPRRAAHSAGSDRRRRRGKHPRRAARSRDRDLLAHGAAGAGSLVPATRREGRRTADRTGHLVRHGVRRRRGAARWAGGVRHRRSELGRAGGAPSRQRGARDDPLPWREPPKVDVAVPRRPHRGDARGDHRPPEHAGGGDARRRGAGVDHDRRGRASSRSFRPRRCSSSSAPSRTRTGSEPPLPAPIAGYILTGAQVLDLPDECSPWPLERHPIALETSVPGIFAAGDVRDQSIKRVASAVGEGSMAVLLVHQYLKAHCMDPGELRRIAILADLARRAAAKSWRGTAVEQTLPRRRSTSSAETRRPSAVAAARG